VKRAYKLAYDLGCKGITVYRQGSREKEVLSTSEMKDPEGKSMEWPKLAPLAVPAYAKEVGLPARVFPIETAFGKMQVNITELEGHPGRPFDVRLSVGKAGNDKLADVEALGRATSLALRTGTDVKYVIDQLSGIGGTSVIGFGDDRVLSVADGLAKLLERLYTDNGGITHQSPTLDPHSTCPLCLNTSLVVESGCSRCETRLGGCGQYEGCS
jgi:ribonucleoside-diphosphate reductase alpha chain